MGLGRATDRVEKSYTTGLMAWHIVSFGRFMGFVDKKKKNTALSSSFSSSTSLIVH